MALIDPKLTDYFKARGVDLSIYVEKPTDSIDAAEIDDLQARLAKTGTGLTDADLDKIEELRKLTGESDLMIAVPQGMTWGVRIGTAFSKADVAILKKLFQVGTSNRLVIDGAAWAKLVSLQGQAGSGVDSALLSRVARGQGNKDLIDGMVVDVNVVPPPSDALTEADIEFVKVAYRVNIVGNRIDADTLRAIGRQMKQLGVDASEMAMLDRFYAASTSKKPVAGITVDVDTPTTRELTALYAKYKLSKVDLPADFLTLARAIDKSGSPEDAAVLRRLAEADGNEVQIAGGPKVKVASQLTGPEVRQLAIDYFGQGFNIDDGVLDAQDQTALTMGFAEKGLGQTEREILIARLTGNTKPYVLKIDNKDVTVDPFSLTASDVDALIDIYGVSVTGSNPPVIDNKSKLDLITQIEKATVPAGLAMTLRKLRAGETVATNAMTTWRTQVQRRLQLMALKPDASEVHKKLTQKLKDRLEAVPFVPFKKENAEDIILLQFAQDLLTPPEGADPQLSLLLMRLDRSNGKTVKTTNKREFKISLEAPPEGTTVAPLANPADDQAMHDYLVRVSRNEKGAQVTWQNGGWNLTYHARNELNGDDTKLTATITSHGLGVRAMWESTFPVHPDVWVGFMLGGGASYEKVGTQHNIQLEAKGGAQLTWYMNRALGMRLDVRAYVTGTLGFQYDSSKVEEAKKDLAADLDRFNTAASAKVDVWKTDVDAIIATMLASMGQAARDIFTQEAGNARGPLTAAALAYLLAQLTPGSADDNAAQAQMTAAQNAMFTAMGARLGPEVFNSQAAKDAVAAIMARTKKLLEDLKPDAIAAAKSAGRHAMEPLTVSYGAVIGGEIQWQALLPMVSTKKLNIYLSPDITLFGSGPIPIKDAVTPGPFVSTEPNASAFPRFGARAGLGMDFRIPGSNFLFGINGGVTVAGHVDSGKVVFEGLSPYAGARFLARW